MTNDKQQERLVELLKNSSQYIKEQDSLIDTIADHLLANGVIVPPCKVGDKVYFAVDDYRDSAIIDGIHITEEGILFTWVQYEVGYELTECWDEGEFDFDDIGKTVFLTREETEEALKGGVQA